MDSTDEGFKKVKDGNYAFFWDTTVNKYKTIEDCQFMEIGPHFDPKGFGIGVPPGAIYREDLSMAILKLSDTGMLHQLENKCVTHCQMFYHYMNYFTLHNKNAVIQWSPRVTIN